MRPDEGVRRGPGGPPHNGNLDVMQRSFILVLGAATALGQARITPERLKMFQPLAAELDSPASPISDEKVALGQMLYFDERLSKSQTISCNSCHPLDRYGVDGKRVSEGHRGLLGTRNAPTVYNAAAHLAQFWDGRALTVEEQAKGPILNPVEMALPSPDRAVAVLKSMPAYVNAFEGAFPDQKDPVTFDNLAAAIGAFERKLTTPSRWDRFLQGDAAALTGEEVAGFNKFVDAGCPACHNGPLVGGTMYQKLGQANPWPDASDAGRFQVTRSGADRLVFKVASLRNVDKTAPYFHDGRVETLDQAIQLMAIYQLGRQLSEEDVEAIGAWLRTLTGDLPANYIRKPELPKRTPGTPLPEISR